MKKIGLLIFSVLALNLACKRTQKDESTSSAGEKGAKIDFLETSYDFGTMTEGDTVQHAFHFKNTGTVPVQIHDVIVQCGCTVASKPAGLVGVGKTDSILVRFNSAGKVGENKKFVRIIANTEKEPEALSFTATVIGKKLN